MVNFTQTFAGPAENPVLNTYYSIPANGTLIEEMIEGFQELIVEFGNLGTAFTAFGTQIQADANELNLRIERSLKTIETAFNDFINAFNVVFVNLSKRLKGETV
jgi:hypothetical protein